MECLSIGEVLLHTVNLGSSRGMLTAPKAIHHRLQQVLPGIQNI
jgi:hypothetical protein